MNNQKIILLKGNNYNQKVKWVNNFLINNPDYIFIDQVELRIYFHNPLNNNHFEDNLKDLEKRLGQISLNLGKSIILNNNSTKTNITYWSLVALTRDIDFEEIEFD